MNRMRSARVFRKKNYNMDFEKNIQKDLTRYLRGLGRLDEMLPECPDLEQLWPSLAEAYLPDGVREFGGYPVVSLGWMMFVGMAMAKYWDTDWEKYSQEGAKGIYERLRDARGYDNLDDFVLGDVLGLEGKEAEDISAMAGECAARVYHALTTSHIEAGTPEAARAYMAGLHQLYLMGVYTELNALGYHLTKVG